MEKSKVKGNTFGLIVVNMKVSGLTIKLLVMVNINGLMGGNTQVFI